MPRTQRTEKIEQEAPRRSQRRKLEFSHSFRASELGLMRRLLLLGDQGLKLSPPTERSAHVRYILEAPALLRNFAALLASSARGTRR